ncbi:hypothetical protein Poli38472_006261 [Pythium oligandrum]|uniref:Uncharacterized protein n=1 Tax=Pythium oligandrum TaxID=41045 RepID=A0A8K1CTS5_PYTOL|nr:hypothetical protein Poli38472_006261 [Pythium oligandrum]|eukprot:TMW68793.1 hypothetical protein Poli38472_006261 [Pythium oligandrum]
MVKKRLMTRGAVDTSTGHATLHRGQSPPLAPMAARKPRSASLSASPPPVQVALLSKNHQSRTELGDGNDVFNLGEIYLNDLSDIRVFELTNTRPHALQVQLKAELRKPFHASACNFQLENENLSLVEMERREPTEEYNHMPSTILRSSMRAALSAENVYLSEGYNELFNHIATINEVWLEPKQTKQVVFAVCTKLTSQQASSTAFAHANADSSEEERLHLNETSCLLVTGRIILKTQFRVRATSEGLPAPVPLPDITIPLQGQVCRSLLRLDVKELHFDDCIPGGSFVKDFTVWNRSEIPLLFQLVSSVSAFDETRHLLTFTDYNTGYVIGEKVLQAAAYGHVRIRVTYRPVEVGERFFEVHVQNLHDSRNVKILQIHAVTNKEHHREGLAIKEPNGSYMMSGSKLDFGDCYSGIATSKALVIRNATEASLHVELTSDRPKEVTFELKLQPNRSRSSRAPRTEDILSPTDSNEGSSRKESLSPDGAKAVANAFARFDSVTAYGVDSDDDGDENEGEYEDDFVPGKRLSFEDNPLDPDDGDDDFEFDREPRPTPRSPPASPKLRTTGRDSRRRPPKFKPRRSGKIHSRVRDLTYESGVDSGNSICSSPERKPRGELRRRNSASLEDVNGSNFLVETIDLPPGMERTILVWYCPSAERNIRIPAKSKQRIIAFFSPSSEQSIAEAAKVRIEKHKILITLPPGGNKKAVADAARFDVTKPMWAISKHPFDSRPSVRELLVKGRVCRSIMNVNQKNINFGRITVSSKSSKKLVVQNMSAVPLVYNVEKTGSISSAFLEIKEGESGVVKGFGTKEICFEFQPTLAGPFEEKLKLVNLQDPENSISVTIKAKVVKRETFKLLQSGQVLSFGRCLVGEKSEEIKIAVRNTSRKRREYVIQLDPAFSNQLLRPVFYFSVDDAPSTIITQAQEKKLDEELEKLEHKLRIAVTKKKTDKITKLNSKISRVKALLSGEDISEGASSEADDGSSVSTLLTDLYDSNSESEFSDSETAPRAQRTKRQGKGQLSDPKAGGTAFSQSANTLHFSLEAEATGRIVAYAVFQPLRSSAVADDATSAHESVPKSMKARKRQLRKDSAPLVGVGKLLLFEQQNKDVMKELQYNAEVFLRTPAGETAYYRAVGKAPLPPFPHQPLTRRTSVKKIDVDGESQVPTGGSRLLVNDIAPTRASLLEPEVFPRSGRSSNQEGVITSPPASSPAHGRVVVKVEQNQLGMFRRSTLLVPIEESPVDSMGWVLNLSHTSAESIEVEVNWRPRDFARGLLTLVSEVNPPDLVAEGSPFARSEAGGQHGDAFVLPFKVQVPPSQQVELHVRWNYTSGSGFGASTSMASCVTSSTLEQVTKNAQMVAGKLEICEVMDGSPKSNAHSATSIEVALVKAIKRSLQAEPEVVDLGQQQQNAAVTGQFVLRNHSSHAVKFLLLSPITGEHAAAGGSVGDFSFESSTGHVEGMSEELVKFTYRGYTPGEHTQQLLVRNLSDRLDTTIVTVKARITRPVYVRIPELDPHATGKLEVLELGPCYVTPEMQDTSVDSPNVALKFSKTHRLTLVSQVDETLVLCASSNLKTQCYVFEDHRLNHEATNVTLAGMGTLDLYVAIRPRLSSDAFKTGSSRDLVGGIRIQLFRVVDKGSQEEDKSHMVAEFTVKFVGIAGASLARVTPMAIDFGVEHRPNGEGKVHDGQFELINVSKALPLDYRLFVSNDNDGYSDLDDGLEVFLNNEKGEVPPGEAAVVKFQVKARSHGLFRRRLLVENTHYVGKISTVEMVLFVDNDAIQCKIESHAALSSSEDDQANRLALHDSLSLGMVPVIKLEDELSPLCAAEGNSELESSHRRYRIYNKQLRGVGGATPGRGVQRLFLTNVSDEDLIVRPISTLPFSFHWSDVATAVITNSWFHVQPTAMSAPVHQVRKLQISGGEAGSSFKTAAVYYGGVYRIPAHGSCGLCFDFAPIAGTPALPTDVMVSGRQFSVQGMIGIQSFASPGLDNSSARTVKMVDVFVSYGESWIQAVDRVISLGKIGCSLGWKSSPFEIAIKNQSEIPACIVIGDLPDCLAINGVRDGSPVTLPDDSAVSKNGSVTLSSLALKATGGSNESPSFRVLELAPLSTCFVDLEFIQGSKTLSAGTSDFDIKLYNLYNPHNIEQVTVSAQIVSSYADVIIDPESSISATEAELDSENVALLPPVMIPPIAEGAPLGPNFWFSIKNVFDEELSIKLLAQSDERFKSSWKLLLFSRSSNTPVSNLSVAPGDSIDVRVICRVFPSARISSDLIVHGVPGGLISFGSVTLDITVQNIPDATQRKEISVRGKIVPGRTFTLSSSSLHFYAASAELAPELSAEFLPPSLKAKARDSSQPSAVASETSKSTVYQLRTSSETFWIRNPSTVQPLNFAIDQVAMYNATLCLIKGATPKDACAMTEYIQAVATPSSGTIQPGEAVKITVRLEEASLLASADGGHFADSGDKAKALASLHKMRHHPSWRSNSWGTDMQDSSNDVNVQNHMYLTVRDVDMSVEVALTSEVDIHLMLQSSSSSIQGNDASKAVVIDRTLLSAAFAAREKRLSTPKKGFLPPLLGSVAETAHREQSDSMVLDNFEEFDVGTIRFSSVGKKNQLPVLSVRGCTPAENSSLDSTRYVIDVGQHTVRNGGEVEWEITIESVYGSAQPSEPGSLDPVEYRLYLVDQSAKSWVQLSRDRGTLDRSRSYQSIVLYFWRDAIGVYSTFVVLQNLTNPGDLKVIHVKLEVVADLNVLRSMVSGVDPSTNLFRVLVSTHGVIRKLRRITSADIAGTIEHEINSSPPRGDPKLVVDYGEVYYHKLYNNHSIVLENSSSMALDFMLSSNALPNEVSFSVSPTSFSEVTTVNLAARGRVQVFLHFRPQPRRVASSDAPARVPENWYREIEVYVNCRLVKDFRETVVLRAICHPPQLAVNVSSSSFESILPRTEAVAIEGFDQPNFLGLVFNMSESALMNAEGTSMGSTVPAAKFLVVHNTRSDIRSRIAIRNDSMFFAICIDTDLPTQRDVEVDTLENGVGAGRRSTLLVTIPPESSVVFRIVPDLEALRKHRQLWDQSVKEHITLYNIKQFAEHYQVVLTFTCSNSLASFYIPSSLTESYPFSALEDMIAKFLQNYNSTWKWLLTYHETHMDEAQPIKSSPSGSFSIPRLAEVLGELEYALDQASPLSPRRPGRSASIGFEDDSDSREALRQLLHSYRALYFDFFYITDELVWYGVRSNAVRRSLMLAELAYGVVFNHEVFRVFLGQESTVDNVPIFPRLLLPWIRQLRHFLSFFPENQEATLPLRQLYDQLHKFELA